MRSVLVYRIGAFGDAIASLPVFTAIFERHSDDDIYLLTTYLKNSAVIKTDFILKRFFSFSGILYYSPGAALQDYVKLIIEIRKKKINFFYYLAPLRVGYYQIIRDYIFFRYLCGIKNISGMKNSLESKSSTAINEASRLLNVVSEKLVTEYLPIRPIFQDAERHKGAKILATLNIQPDDYVVAICPGSKMLAKRWPIDRFINLCLKISNETRVKFIIFGDAHEAELASSLKSALGSNAVSCAGITTVFESAFLLNMCNLYIGNDTGVMHLAAVMGVPCIAVFSDRDKPGKWSPMGFGHMVLRANISCSGCMLEECPIGNACLKLISVDNVFEVFLNKYYKNFSQTLIKSINL